MVRFLILCLSVTGVLLASEAYSAGEVAKHGTAASCWLIIDDGVFDVTKYLQRHREFDYDLTRHCGGDASRLWHKKPRTGDSHSRKAERLLERYRVGDLKK